MSKMKNRYRASHRLHLIHTQYYYKNAIGSGYPLYLLLRKAPQKDAAPIPYSHNKG